MHRRIIETLVVSVVALAGCGGDDQRFGEFVGTWHYDTATGTLTCRAPVNQAFDVPPIINKVFQDGIVDVLVDVSPSLFDGVTTCDTIFDVSDKTATVRTMPSQPCPLAGGDMVTPMMWRFTLIGPNKAEETGGALVNAIFLDNSTTPPTEVPVPCDYTMQANLTRVAAD